MRIGVVGIGGIGGYFGSRLIDRYRNNEHEVLFIQRGAHLEAIRRGGLRYVTAKKEFVVNPALATDRPSEAGHLDLAILCTKGYDLESAAQSIRGNLDKNSVVLTTLNGVNIAQRVKQVLPDTIVLPGCIYISAHVEQPGVVKQVGTVGNVFFGPLQGPVEPYRAIEQLLKDAGIKADLTADIKTKLWEKYLFVCPFATVTSVRDITMGQVMADPGAKAELICLMKEIQALAKAEGVVLSDAAVDNCMQRAAGVPPETLTSMQVDVKAGKRVELDVFTGYVSQKGKDLGLDLPCHFSMFGRLQNMLGNRNKS